MTADLVVSGVTKAFGAVQVLRGVELTVPAGSVTAVLGRSGSGKSTLLRIVAGFDEPDGGTVALRGRVVAGEGRAEPPERRGVGYVTQEGSLFPHLRVADNIVFGLSRSRRQRRDRVEELLDLVDLDGGYARRWPHELSGGQQQRVALARALAPDPGIVLLDEPFSSLDAELRESTREAVAAALARAGATALLVTHDHAEALSLADRVAVLREGRFAQVAPPAEIYRSPIDPDAGRHVGDALLLDGRGGARSVSCALGDLPVRARPGTTQADGDVHVLVRPEQLTLTVGTASGVPARVVATEFFGQHTDVLVDVGTRAGTTMRLTARTTGDEPLAAGAEVTVTVAGPVSTYPR